MSDTEPRGVKDYADGWITERTGTDVPVFLKAAYIVIALGCILYGIVYMNGETTHDTRGTFVQQFNAVTGNANAFMYVVAALALVFAISLFVFAFRKARED
ncbi:MAG: hypothetical protein AB1806_12835 [Acidobacteriota bacterium]